MRLRTQDILKPGAVLRTEKIDFDDPEVKAMLRAHRAALRKLRRIRVFMLDEHGWRRIKF